MCGAKGSLLLSHKLGHKVLAPNMFFDLTVIVGESSLQDYA